MNSRNVNNLTLNEKIKNFKNKYTELLMQLDNSYLLNLTKFEDLEKFQGTDNIYSLLKENEKVSNNLQLIKESIKKKIINLQLLSTKTNDQDTIEAYANLYDFDALNGASLNNYLDGNPGFSKSQILKISSDIDAAIKKVDEISDFIENKVIPKLNNDEQEKKDLTILLNDSQRKIDELLAEKSMDQQAIERLHASNKEWEDECNKLIDFSVEINQKLISLEALIDENERASREISTEKDKIIEQLEKKLNDLLSDIDSDNFFSLQDFKDVYNTSDSFVSLISKIINNTFKHVYEIEKSFNTKVKDFNKQKSLLVADLGSYVNKKNEEPSLISNMIHSEIAYDVKEETVEFTNQLFKTKTTRDFTDYLWNNFSLVFQKIGMSLSTIFNELNSQNLNDGEYFSKRSIRKINNLCVQISGYMEKNNLLYEQVDHFINILNIDFNTSSFSLVNFNSFWWESPYGYKLALEKFVNDFGLVSKIISLFLEYIGLRTNNNQFVNYEQEFKNIVNETQEFNISENDNKVVYTPKEQQPEQEQVDDQSDIEDFVNFSPIDALHQESNKEFEEQLSNIISYQVNELINEADESYNKYDYDHNTDDEIDISNIKNQVDVDFDNSVGDINDLKPDLDNGVLENLDNDTNNDFSKQYLNTRIEQKDFESFVNDVEKQEELFDIDALEDINSINEFSQNIENLDSLDNKLSELLDKQQPLLDQDLVDINKQIQDFNDFVKKIIKDLEYKTNLDSSQKILLKNELYKIFSDEDTTVKEKLIQLEEYLLAVFEKDYYTKLFQYWIVAFKKYLLEKKYNINLKLRVAKSKFNKLKMLIELERDKNYLSLFNDE